MCAQPRCECAYGYGGDDCSVNQGLLSLLWTLSVAGGVLGGALCLALTLYYLRARAAGQVIGPRNAYRERQWMRASRSASVNLAIHVPKRSAYDGPKRFATEGQRVRIGPVT